MDEPTLGHGSDTYNVDESRPLLDDPAGEDPHSDTTLMRPSISLAGQSFTWRSVAIGLIIGILVCLTNIHFGLQTGYINIMQMPSALIGFGVFQMLRKHVQLPFSPEENVLIQTVASSVGAMPATAGLVGVIPALEYLVAPADGGPVKLTLPHLLAWSAGVSAFGLVFAMILRKRIILYEKLRFPTGTATALLINVLHAKEEPSKCHIDLTSNSITEEHFTNPVPYNEDPQNEALLRAHDQGSNWQSSLKILSSAMGVSGTYTLLTYFVPILHNIPIFGQAAASQWLWSFNLSFGYFGQGIITGPAVLLNMLVGAVVGWGILSPLAQWKNWAPGPVSDWDSGSRGWIVWISLSAMLADAIVDLIWFTARILFAVRGWAISSKNDSLQETHARSSDEANDQNIGTQPSKSAWGNMLIGLLMSIAICIPAVRAAFGSLIPVPTILMAVVISLPLCVMGIKAVGTTDHNPASGIAKLCQLIIGRLVSRTNPNALAVNLVAGGIAEAGAVQSGFMMQNLKTGHLTGASSTTQFYGQLLGSVLGAIVSSALYHLYTFVYQVPGDIFQVPSAFIWLAGARLAIGEGLPEGVPKFALMTAITFGLCAIARLRYSNRSWCYLIPSGIPFAVGMYNVPSFTLARAIGGVAQWYWASYLKKSETPLIVFASGLILGEGLASIISLVLEASHVPHL